MESVDIIITCKNNEDAIERCLESVFNQSNKNIAVYLCDDGSTDNTLKIVKEKFKQVNILNLGHMPAENRNEGIRRSNSKYIVTLDSDAYLTKDWVKDMVVFMESDEKVGIAGGKILLDENTLQSAGGVLTKRGNCFDRGIGLSSSEYSSLEKVAFACSASMMIRREMLKEIGIFEPYYLYSVEDTDLGLRANLAGWDVVYNPNIYSFHDVHKTVEVSLKTERFEYLCKRNLIFMMLTNFQFFTLIGYFPLYLMEFLYQIMFNPRKITTLKAYLSILVDVPYLLKVRKFNQRNRKISDIAFLKKINARI